MQFETKTCRLWGILFKRRSSASCQVKSKSMALYCSCSSAGKVRKTVWHLGFRSLEMRSLRILCSSGERMLNSFSISGIFLPVLCNISKDFNVFSTKLCLIS
eukprot:TRINITY_DN16545_c0_g1_i1.p1 TRINITY_DN16545_c0_g1~~TRINITY_DN16545_c0_g1_i1.p1  ORF type:complete len:102 (+),score=13.23 TRINITY_DN16545_c0_g1_i1:140-445(+)